jgi:hypothetical protein
MESEEPKKQTDWPEKARVDLPEAPRAVDIPEFGPAEPVLVSEVQIPRIVGEECPIFRDCDNESNAEPGHKGDYKDEMQWMTHQPSSYSFESPNF